MLLSIITVVLNCVDTIERTIKSVIEQDCNNVEYIIIDGASTDGTLDIIKKYEDKITYWISEPDEGIYHAMNKGINVSTGEWVTFMNGNDWYEPNVFVKLAEILENCISEIVYGKVNKIENGKKNGYIGISEETNPELLHTRNLYCHQGLFIRKKLFDMLGLYDCKYKILADYDWILKAHTKGINPQYVDTCLANFSMGGVSCSGKTRNENYEIVKKNYVEHEKLECLKRPLGIFAFRYFYEQNIKIFEKIVDPCKSFYIWGTGVYGKKIVNLMKKLDCNVIGYIDSNVKNKFIEDKEVFLSTEILQNKNFLDEKNSIICVASEKYELEIIEILNKCGITREKFISVSVFFECAYDEFLST